MISQRWRWLHWPITATATPRFKDLFGVVWATDKDMPFALGVSLDMSDPQRSVVRISNRPDRAVEIAASIDSVLEVGKVDPKLIPSLWPKGKAGPGKFAMVG